MKTTKVDSQVRASSHIAVDLSHKNIFDALLSLQRMRRRMEKIKSAEVYTSRPNVGVHRSFTAVDIIKIFVILGGMPNLRTIKVNLNHPHHLGDGALPLAALTRLLVGARRLKSMQLHQLDIQILNAATVSSTAVGDAIAANASNAAPNASSCTAATSDLKEFGQAMQRHKHFHSIEVVDCVGGAIGAVLASIAKHSKHLRAFSVVGTSLLPNTLNRLLVVADSLKVLKLQDIPDITDEQVAKLSRDLASPDCQLEELEIRSNIVTEKAGEALATMLWVNQSIHTLCLHLDCENLGDAMARCFRYNTTLRQVDLRCYGDDEAVSECLIRMANALSQPTFSSSASASIDGSLASMESLSDSKSHLKKLRLCLEIEPYEFQQEILAAFSSALRCNDVLEELILDDGIEPYPLTDEMKFQLKMNRCGYSRYASNAMVNRVSIGQYVNAIAAENDDTDVIFTILSQHPDIICQAAFGGGGPTQSTVSAYSGNGVASHASSSKGKGLSPYSTDEEAEGEHEQPQQYSPKKKSAQPLVGLYPVLKSGSSKSIRRRVMSLLAPSA